MAMRTATVVAMTAAALFSAARLTAAADAELTPVAPAAPGMHLRWDTPVIGAAIRDAIERSRTFREMVDAINASDAYIVISAAPCGHGVRACFVSVRTAGANRYMFVRVASDKRDAELMASLGHELRHTLEVIADPSVRSDFEKFFFYERTALHGPSHTTETLAARDAGNAVRDEINRFNRDSQTR
jgi:hypothetical protein